MICYSDMLAFVEYIDASLDSRFVQVGSIGHSVLGRAIPFVTVGNGKNVVIVQAAIHAREYATMDIVIMWIFQHLLNCNSNAFDNLKIQSIQKYIEHIKKMSTQVGNTKDLAEDISFCYIPCLNPDGVLMAQSDKEFILYKANANGVDLNTNFDAKWGTGLHNKRVAGASDFIGCKPHDQPETRAIVDFSLKTMPISTVSMHARGREIYCDFWADECAAIRDNAIASQLAQYTGYKVVSSQQTSSGGYKDWCIQKLKIPSFTIECFDENETFPIEFEKVVLEYNLLSNLPLVLANSLKKYVLQGYN